MQGHPETQHALEKHALLTARVLQSTLILSVCLANVHAQLPCLTATATTCTDLDSNSRCANLNCDCATGYDVYGSSSKCQSAGSGSVGLMASAFMLAVGVFFTILSF
ncbi:hypothetical protein DPMN_188120 [Dreissena polymorpha]|uniref:Extracellular membrane protein CFEM domain-containing protein n=1 Tax=Dreissena polymorpha TaxID=45954 RepID=A0A9D4DR19_DREPO|nr:hypothetical protein DPMN_188120 [Dreissena polymorpha]